MSADGSLPARYVPPRRFDHDAILDRWAAGDSSGAIGEALGMTDRQVRDVVQEYRSKGDSRAIPHPTVRTSWSDEMVTRLRQLWAEGLSASQIAKILGFTRNAVIGKAHRIDLPMRLWKRQGQGLARKPPTDNRYPRPRKSAAQRAADAKERMRRLREERKTSREWRRRLMFDPPPAPDMLNVALLDLEARHCRFPIGDPREADFGFCGSGREGVHPYCLYHMGIAYRLSET